MAVKILASASPPMLVGVFNGQIQLTNQTATVITISEIKNINQCTIEWKSRLVAGTDTGRTLSGRFKRYSTNQFWVDRYYAGDGNTVEFAYTVKEYASNVRVDEILTTNIWGYKDMTIPAIKDMTKQFVVAGGSTNQDNGNDVGSVACQGYLVNTTTLRIGGGQNDPYLTGLYVVSW